MPPKAKKQAESLRQSVDQLTRRAPVSREADNPVLWIQTHLGLEAWLPHQAQWLQAWPVLTRVLRKARKVGATTVCIAAEAIWRCLRKPDQTILIVTPSERQSLLVVFKAVADVLNGADSYVRGQILNMTKTRVDFTNGSYIQALPCSPDRLRGFTADHIYCDEAAHFLSDEPLLRIFKPMLGPKAGGLSLISTPAGKRVDSMFYSQYMLASDHPIPGVREKYDYLPSTLSPLITQEFLDRERESLTQWEYEQEYLGLFIEALESWLPMNLISPRVSEGLEMVNDGVSGGVYVFGLDLGKVRDPTVLILLQVEAERKHVTVCHIDEYPGMEYSDQIGRILQLPKRFGIVGGTVDMTGVGLAVCEDLLNNIPGAEGLTFTQQSKADMANLAKKYFEEARITIPNNPKLIMQLNNLSYKYSKGGHLLFDNVQQRFHDDYAWSLFLAVWAAEQIIKRGAGGDKYSAIFVTEGRSSAEYSDEELNALAISGPMDPCEVFRH